MAQQSRIRGIRCGLGSHILQGEPVFVTDNKHLSFIRKRRKHFRADDPVCNKCLTGMKIIYGIKHKRAVELSKHSSLTVSSTTAALSDDSIDRIVNQSERRLPLRSKEQQNNLNQSSSSSISNSTVLNNLRNGISSGRVAELRSTYPSTDDNESDNDRPTTSAAAAVRRLRTRSPTTKTGASANANARRVADNDEYTPSPNALNGTRLPDVQPIIKRRKVVQLNQEVMDRYIRTGLLGG